MPELFPPRPVHFEQAAGTAVSGWATFYNPDTEMVTVEWTSRSGARTQSYLAAECLVRAADDPGAGQAQRQAG